MQLNDMTYMNAQIGFVIQLKDANLTQTVQGFQPESRPPTQLPVNITIF